MSLSTTFKRRTPSLIPPDQQLRAAHAAAEAERTSLLSSPPPLADLLRAVEEQVDRHGAAWRAAVAPSLILAAGGALDVSPTGAVRGVIPGDLRQTLPGALGFAEVCGLFPDQVKTALTRVLEEASVPTAGPPLAARAGLIAAVDDKLRRLEAEHARLVDAAAAEGIQLAHLPGEHGRRVRKAQHDEFVRAHNALNAAAIRRGAVEPMR